MSAAQTVAEIEPPKKSRKKLIVIALALLMLLGAGGGAYYYFVVKKNADAAAAAAASDDEEGAEAGAAAHKAAKGGHRPAPNYVALEPFVVNLADKDSDRFAQIGITFEVEDAKFADEMKVYMPAIRNGILMVLAHKTSTQLQGRSGKQELAAELMREAARPMGIEIPDEEDEDSASHAKDDAATDEAPAPTSKKKTRKKKKKKAVHNPISNVHFSNFIIQ